MQRMKATIQACQLKKLVNHIGVDEVKVDISRKGLRIAWVDPCHVQVGVHTLPIEVFEEFKTSKNFSIGVDVDKLKEFLKIPNAKDLLHIDVECNERSGRMLIQVPVGNGYGAFLERKIALMDTAGMEFKMPRLLHRKHFHIEGKELFNVLKALNGMTSEPIFHANKKGVKIYGQDNGENTIILPAEDLENYEIKTTAKVTLTKAYLELIRKAARDFSDVAIYLRTDYPAKFECYGNGELTDYYIAPIIEPEEEDHNTPEAKRHEKKQTEIRKIVYEMDVLRTALKNIDNSYALETNFKQASIFSMEHLNHVLKEVRNCLRFFKKHQKTLGKVAEGLDEEVLAREQKLLEVFTSTNFLIGAEVLVKSTGQKWTVKAFTRDPTFGTVYELMKPGTEDIMHTTNYHAVKRLIRVEPEEPESE